MYLFLNLALYIQFTYQYAPNNNTLYNDSVLAAFCEDVKQKETLNCQPNFNTQVGNGNTTGFFPMPTNTQTPFVRPTTDYNIGMVNPTINPPPVHSQVIQSPTIQVPIVPPSTLQPSIPPNITVQPNSDPKSKYTPHTQITLSSIPLPKQKTTSSGQKLSSVLNENPIAKTQLINFLEYNGVPPPWDQLLDFETTQHHQLPDPDNLFRKIRKQLLTFDKVKTCIVEALVVIEKYINRGKAYLAEDLKDLCRDKTLLKNILKRLRTKPAYEFRSELFKRYADIKCKSTATQKSFYKLRDWLLKIKKLFATL